MFESIRRHQRLLLGFLLLLIFPAFAFFGISGYDRFFSDEGVVARVGGDRITRQEFDLAQRRQIENLRQILGDQVDPALYETPAMRAEIVNSLVVQRLLAQKAYAEHIAVPDAQLRKVIAGIDGLRRPDGSFDNERYRAMLAAQGKSEVGFESEVRRDLALQVLPEAIAQTEFLPRAVLERLIAASEQRRDVRELLLRPQDFVAQVRASEADLRKHYQDNVKAFETPESADVEYLVLSAESVASQIALNPEEVRAYYEQNRARFGTAEERRASHILLEVGGGATRDAALAKARELLAQLRAGGDFAALAKAHSQDPGSAAQGGDLGFFTRETMSKAFAEAAFALGEGQVSEPVETEFGVHLIRLTAIKGGSVPPFEQVRAQIEGEIRTQQASRKFAEMAENFTNTVYEQADSLQPAAERFKLTIRKASGLQRAALEKLPADSPLRNAKLLGALFSEDSLRNRRNTEAIDVGAGVLVSARVTEYRPAQALPFEEVQARVRAEYTEREARRLAVSAGQQRLQALREGKAEPDGFGAVRVVSRAAPGSYTPDTVEQILRVPAPPLPAYAGVDRGAEGYLIARIEKVSLPDAAELAARRPQYRQQATQMLGQQVLADYLAALKAATKVSITPPRASDAPLR